MDKERTDCLLNTGPDRTGSKRQGAVTVTGTGITVVNPVERVSLVTVLLFTVVSGELGRDSSNSASHSHVTAGID